MAAVGALIRGDLYTLAVLDSERLDILARAFGTRERVGSDHYHTTRLLPHTLRKRVNRDTKIAETAIAELRRRHQYPSD